MEKNVNSKEINEQVNGVPEDEVQNNEQVNGVNYKNTIKKLVANGCKRINSVRIKNVNFTEKDDYTMISFTLDSNIVGYVSNDDGITYHKGETNILFTSLFAITGAFKEDEELSWMANYLLKNPNIINLVLNGATVDILQQEISAGEEFVNPFTTKRDPEPRVYDHDIIINHVINFKLGKIGWKMADKLADKLLGF